MNPKQRTVLIAAVVALLLIAFGVWWTEPVYVLLAVAVALLGALVIYNRFRSRSSEDEWDEYGDEWGLESDVDDDNVDLDARLGELGFDVERRTEPTSLSQRLDTDQASETDRGSVDWDEEAAFAEAAVYEVQEPVVAADDDDEHTDEYEQAVEQYEEHEEYEEYEDEDLDAEAAVLTDDIDEEYEELVEEYEEYEEYEDEGAQATAESLFVAPGVIDEERLDSDEAILAASEATSLQYDDVLSREDANAETREILSRVASLLAKYE